MSKPYLSFNCWCVEVSGIIYYNYLYGSDYERAIEDYIEYCEEKGYGHDYEE